jgi:endonuclease/exonuclease/phosphatase family metal-dependent hydrolase
MFLGKATAWISPEQSTVPTFFGLFFPYLAIINCMFIVFWLVIFKWQAIIPILALLFFWGELRASFSFFETSAQKPENATEIKIMTYNIAYFSFFKKNCASLDYIAQSGADIVCLQEFGYYKKSDEHFALKDIDKKMAVYPYRSFHLSERPGGRMLGMAIFSKYPIVNEDSFLKESLITLPLSRRMYADVKIGNDTLRVFNAYLKSNSLNRKDKAALFEMADKLDTSALDSIATNLFSKIGTAAQIRSIQSQHIAAQIADSPYPVIVCSDFNDTPVSYSYKTIGKGLIDAFVGSGTGRGITYHENVIRVRIDYLLHSKDIVSSDFRIERVEYSDHYPVQASFWLKK